MMLALLFFEAPPLEEVTLRLGAVMKSKKFPETKDSEWTTIQYGVKPGYRINTVSFVTTNRRMAGVL